MSHKVPFIRAGSASDEWPQAMPAEDSDGSDTSESDGDAALKEEAKPISEAEANREAHELHHRPFDANCDICVEGKLQGRRHNKHPESESHELTKFGECVTMDHIDAGVTAIEGAEKILHIKDVGQTS